MPIISTEIVKNQSVNGPFAAMELAVNALQKSSHSTHKIGAALIGWDISGNEIISTAFNHWPKTIENTIGRATRIGNSSGTIHAEVAAILSVPKTDGGMMFLTDPPCPNCMKNMIEAGIRTLYIDHIGFDKTYMIENSDHVEDMSLQIARHAGMGVFKLFRKEKRIETLVAQGQDIDITDYNPLREILLGQDDDVHTRLHQFLKSLQQTGFKEDRFAACAVKDDHQKRFLWLAEPHPVFGSSADINKIENSKYSFTVEPITRLLMSARRLGVIIEPESVVAYLVPSSRELVNFVAAGFHHIKIHHADSGRDKDALNALALLTSSKIIISS